MRAILKVRQTDRFCQKWHGGGYFPDLGGIFLHVLAGFEKTEIFEKAWYFSGKIGSRACYNVIINVYNFINNNIVNNVNNNIDDKIIKNTTFWGPSKWPQNGPPAGVRASGSKTA